MSFPDGMKPPGHGPQHDPPTQLGSKLQGAHFEPGPVIGVQSSSFWQIPTELHAPTLEQKH